MKTSELKALIKSYGGRFKENDKKHAVWVNPLTGAEASLPRHEGKEVPTGTVSKILKQLGYK